jgi:hypothetical protein
MVACLSEAQLISRVRMMRPGESTVYFQGNLAESAFYYPKVARLRDAAQRLSNMKMLRPSGEIHAGMGLVTLVQFRAGESFSYIATKLR